ncbi:MAG: ATP-binding cassette domain-containing protein [Cypionkella sp.]
MAFIFISHKLQEIADITTQVTVLRNGRVAWAGASAQASIGSLGQLMGGDTGALHRHAEAGTSAVGEAMVRVGGRFTEGLGRDLDPRRGEIVGLAGQEGCGQKDLLHAIFTASAHSGDVVRQQKASFMAGDGSKKGVFPLCDVLFNTSIGRIATRGFLRLASIREEARAVAPHTANLQLDEGRFPSNILELSGGNQQKALAARALATQTPIVLLDDPTRGVDVANMQDFYRLCNQAAQSGRTLIWHSTEDAELLAAGRVLVLAGGRVVRELVGAEITDEASSAPASPMLVRRIASLRWKAAPCRPAPDPRDALHRAGAGLRP